MNECSIRHQHGSSEACNACAHIARIMKKRKKKVVVQTESDGRNQSEKGVPATLWPRVAMAAEAAAAVRLQQTARMLQLLLLSQEALENTASQPT